MLVLQVEWGMINLPNIKNSMENLYFQRSYTRMINENAPKGAE